MQDANLLAWAIELDAARDVAALRAAANRIIHRSGLQLFCLSELGNRYRRHEYTLFGNFPSGWLTSRYPRLPQADANDPVVRHVVSGMPPVCWSARGQVLGPHQGTSGTKQLLASAGRYGLRAGLTVPLVARASNWSFMTFATDETNDARDLMGVLASTTYFAMLLRCAYDRLRPGSELTLSPRQYEVLRLSARGLSAREIGDRLGVRPRTVYTHVENAAQRMNVPQREAVEAARALGLIPAG